MSISLPPSNVKCPLMMPSWHGTRDQQNWRRARSTTSEMMVAAIIWPSTTWPQMMKVIYLTVSLGVNHFNLVCFIYFYPSLCLYSVLLDRIFFLEKRSIKKSILYLNKEVLFTNISENESSMLLFLRCLFSNCTTGAERWSQKHSRAVLNN